MVFGIALVLFGGYCGGRIALGAYEQRFDWQLRLGYVIASIFAIMGAMLDVPMRVWGVIGLIPLARALDHTYVVVQFGLYIGISIYLTTALFYRRVIPFDVSGFRKKRRRL